MKILLSTGLLFIAHLVFSQVEHQPAVISQKLDSLAINNPGLEESLTMTVNDLTVGELIRALGVNHNLNFNVSPSLNNQVVVTSFAEVPVKDVIIFLVKEYKLQVEFTQNILSFSPYVKPKETPVYQPKIPSIEYSPEVDLITFDFENDSIKAVTKEITKTTGKNVIFTPPLKDKLLSGFIQNSNFESALEKLALINDMSVSQSEDGFFVLEPEKKSEASLEPDHRNRNITSQGDLNAPVQGLDIYTNDSVTLSVNAKDIPLSAVIENVSHFMDKEYFIYDNLEGTVNLSLTDLSYDSFLDYTLNGTQFAYTKSDDVYLFGNQNTQGLRNTEVIKLENRTVEKITEHIPSELTKELYVKEFLDMNALVVSGSSTKIRDLRNFVREIDQVIPMVYIEVMIVDVNKSKSISAGISAGLGNQPEPVQTGGTLSPGVDFQMNSASVNNLINSFNGFGIVNLGNVSPDFYLSIQALETAGVLKTRSTPKLSALNGQEANLNIGRTEYYLEIRNDLIGTQNPTLSSSQVYKPISANTSLLVTPFVSRDEQVTLEIQVVQSDFTERISETAPPGNVQRDFKSIVRVRNGDMIILGGLENDTKSETGRGLPLISRIPVLKWIFGRRTKSTSESKLSIFLRTSIIY